MHQRIEYAALRARLPSPWPRQESILPSFVLHPRVGYTTRPQPPTAEYDRGGESLRRCGDGTLFVLHQENAPGPGVSYGTAWTDGGPGGAPHHVVPDGNFPTHLCGLGRNPPAFVTSWKNMCELEKVGNTLLNTDFCDRNFMCGS